MSYRKTDERLKKLIASALFVAIAYFVRFLFHFDLGFLTFEFKDAILAIGALFLGPVWGLLMAAVTALLEFATLSGTGVYGLIMNFAAAGAYVTTASLIYRFRRTYAAALTGLLLGTVALAAVMLPLNLLVTPRFMGVAVGEVAAMIPAILLPFNLVKGIANSGVVLLLYKPTSNALKHTGFRGRAEEEKLNRRATLLSVVIAVLLLAGAFTLFFFVLSGTVSFFHK